MREMCSRGRFKATWKVGREEQTIKSVSERHRLGSWSANNGGYFVWMRTEVFRNENRGSGWREEGGRGCHAWAIRGRLFRLHVGTSVLQERKASRWKREKEALDIQWWEIHENWVYEREDTLRKKTAIILSRWMSIGRNIISISISIVDHLFTFTIIHLIDETLEYLNYIAGE